MSESAIQKFSRAFSGKIWSIVGDEQTNRLAIEVRYTQHQQVRFYIFDLRHRKWIWDDVEFEETWLLSLLAITGSELYLNYFADEANPENKKIIVVDTEQQQVFKELTSMPVNGNKGLTIPLHYGEESSHFNAVKEFMKKYDGSEIVSAVDYLEYRSVIIISYYLRNVDKLENFLLVMDKGGNRKLAQLLGEKLEGIGLETFFCLGQFLITIKDKNELLIYELWND